MMSSLNDNFLSCPFNQPGSILLAMYTRMHVRHGTGFRVEYNSQVDWTTSYKLQITPLYTDGLQSNI